MAILTDGVHLVSDSSVEELHAFAALIPMKREWFQGPPEHRFPHYDLMSDFTRRRAAMNSQFVTSRELVRRAIRVSDSSSPPSPETAS